MQSEDKSLLADKLNALQDVYGKPPITAKAFVIWWETLREFSHVDVFTILGYWAVNNSKPPLPNDVWKQCNEKRTDALENKARHERESNRLPVSKDFKPTEYGRKMLKECLRILSKKRDSEGRHGWARKIMSMQKDGANLHYFTVSKAMSRLKEINE